jgi:hypothetical protein
VLGAVLIIVVMLSVVAPLQSLWAKPSNGSFTRESDFAKPSYKIKITVLKTNTQA